MKVISDFPYKVADHPHMLIPMRDGAELSARVWLPIDAPPAGVIFEHLPYRKRDGTTARDEFNHNWFAGHGYAVIRTDLRGTGETAGIPDDEYTEQEFQDAEDVIAWAAAQEWSNGNVGMIGISWGGFNGLQVAQRTPEALKAVITICSTVDRYADDIHYKGGCLLGENFGWAMNMLSYYSRPPDPELVGDDWADMWKERIEGQEFGLDNWLAHQHRNDYWKHGSICEDYSTIKAAVLSVGGWHDGYRNTISHVVENIKGAKGLVGPWNHKYPNYAGPKPQIGFLQEAKAWWDQYLMGIDTGRAELPDYRAYLMDGITPKRWVDHRAGRWIAEAEWPSKTIQDWRLYAGADGLVGAPETLSEQIASPADCGWAAGEFFPFAFGDELPDAQNAEDDVSLVFDGEPVDAPIDIVGTPHVKFNVASDQQTGQVAVRLCDVSPSGVSSLITYGVLNLTHHNSHENPQALTPDQAVDCELALDQIAYRLAAGHRLRLAFSNAYFPLIWPSAQVTKLTLNAAQIDVPVRALAQGDEVSFEPSEGAKPWDVETLREGSYTRDILRDDTGTTTQIKCDFGKLRDRAHGLINGSEMSEAWTIHPDDPLCASVTAEWHQEGGREGAMWRAVARGKMWSDADNFYWRAELCAELNGEEFARREFSNQVKRDLV